MKIKIKFNFFKNTLKKNKYGFTGLEFLEKKTLSLDFFFF